MQRKDNGVTMGSRDHRFLADLSVFMHIVLRCMGLLLLLLLLCAFNIQTGVDLHMMYGIYIHIIIEL